MSLAKAATTLHQDAETRAQEDREKNHKRSGERALERWEREWYKPHTKELIDGLDALPELVNIEVLSEPGKHPYRMRGISDGIAFLFTTEHNRDGWRIERTCPFCEEKVGERWHSLEQLGEHIAAEQAHLPVRSITHTCYESAARRIARELQYESNNLKITPGDLVMLALDSLARLPR